MTLRTLLTRIVGGAAEDDAAGPADRSGRRGVLRLLVLAPIAAPVATKAVAESVMSSASHRALGVAGTDIQAFDAGRFWARYPGRRFGTDVFPLHLDDKVSAPARRLDEQIAQSSEGLVRVIPGNPAAGIRLRSVIIPHDAAFLAIDDAGSGP